MKGLLIRTPWINLILNGQKKWEMRSRDTTHRGEFLLIQSGSGLIVGQANLVGTQKLHPAQFGQTKRYHCVDDLALLNRWCYAGYWKIFKSLIPPSHTRTPKGR